MPELQARSTKSRTFPVAAPGVGRCFYVRIYIYLYIFLHMIIFVIYVCVCSRSSRQVSMFAFFGEREKGGGTLKIAMGVQFQADCFQGRNV